MEKYRRFADQGTGIQPFVPMRQTGGAVTSYVVRPLVFLLKLPFVLTAGLLFALLGLLLPALVSAVVPPVGALLRSVFQKPLASLLLLTLGVWVSHRTWPLSASGSTAGISPAAGEVVFTNFCSYIDVLFHTSQHAPLFAFAHDDTPTNTAQVLTFGPLGAIQYACKSDAEQRAVFASGRGVALKEAVDAASKRCSPLLLFFEGTPTNGKGVLAPPAGLLRGLEKKTPFHLQALVYHDSSSASAASKPSLTFPSIGSAAEHVYLAVATPFHSVRAVSVSAANTPRLSFDPAIFLKTLVSGLCESSGLRAMSVGRKDKAAFLEHWHTTQGKNYLG